MNRGKLISIGARTVAIGGVLAGVGAGWTKGQLINPPPPLGAPLPGLTTTELSAWNAGKNAFGSIETESEGLGPVFNGVSCGQCHKGGALGGSSTDVTTTRVTRIGGIVNGAYSDLTNLGGPVIERHSLREIDPNYPYPGEVVPAGAQFVSHRLTLPIFGDGLIEAIPGSTIVANAQTPRPDGIHGAVNWVFNPETNTTQVGRYGWKAQVSQLHVFSGDAYLNEIGITSKYFPKDNLPQGRTDPNGADKVADPEDGTNDVAAFTNFARFMAPPPPLAQTSTSDHGRQLFMNMNCGACHLPVMQTGTSFSAALTNKPVHLWSDLLIHHMGAGLADGVRQGSAAGDQWRTTPLWGLRFRQFFLHDGRAGTVDQAILMHGGEAQASRDRYANLSSTDKSAVLDFLSRI